LIFETVRAGAMEQATRRFAAAGTSPQIWLVEHLIPKEFRRRRRQHLIRSREKVLRRLAKPDDDHRDFIWYILKQKERHDLKQDEVIVNGALFIVAGSETTANALSGLTARLIRNPEKYEKLVKEIRSAFATEDQITNERCKDLVYMNACIEEGLRVHPPVPAGLLRTVPKGGDYIDGNWVPGGTSVAVSSWAASHNPNNFSQPDAFIPERWIDSKEWTSDNKKGMQPFSLGPRGCIGKHLSYMEMRVILARLLWNFDLVCTDEAWEWEPEGDMRHMVAFNTWLKPSINLKV
jgi:cytochrome P450